MLCFYYFSAAQKIIVSRNILEVVDNTKIKLRCNASYWEQDDKVAVILEQARQRGVKCVLIFGDSKEDAAPIPALRAAGYKVDFVYVQKQYDPKTIHPDATIAITRNSYQTLYTALQKAT